MHKFSPLALQNFVSEALKKEGASEYEASVVSEVTISADLMGIPSHGIRRLPRYLDAIKNGTIQLSTHPELIADNQAISVFDAKGGFGQVVGNMAIEHSITKAKTYGVSLVSIRNSNHFGIASHYIRKALQHNVIAFAFTNTSPLVVPFNGLQPLLGTNPICIAIPTLFPPPFILDISTSVTSLGKIEDFLIKHQNVPEGWAIDGKGGTSTDPTTLINNLKNKKSGGLLPLGGTTKKLGGHKGFGLGLVVEILSAILAGSAFLDLVYPQNSDGSHKPANIGHLFGAIDISFFRPLDDFFADMALFCKKIRCSKQTKKILLPGENEYLCEQKRILGGIPLSNDSLLMLGAIATLYNLKFPDPISKK